ncbi:protein of unknown function [Pseudorhizobium banfieldiae]|uniref:DUF6968 domain-containing protein n=1 Tax=Pseudorhizobium banfieldiae TaxID=1125847 RepID=L0NI33_9HYPH|nr:hypothetical protein [Pseudorhizobium banfieldiae]CAD6616577.1 hypothetical protein RNT25_03155 [arsenite-oxidising bacterium NT-25]CAD6620067.1 hypothetical protein RTCK_03877 [Rhizobium sp. TCK]CCF20544.1 protein of unknown function [Pseudorhizobium banfieldiae]
MDNTPFVERRFELDGAPLVVRFQVPAMAPTGEFQCRWSIGWPEGEMAHRTCGEDGVQALTLAMQAVHDRLRDSAAYKTGRLTLWGQSDLDLPPSWTRGQLYTAPSPPGAKEPRQDD